MRTTYFGIFSVSGVSCAVTGIFAVCVLDVSGLFSSCDEDVLRCSNPVMMPPMSSVYLRDIGITEPVEVSCSTSESEVQDRRTIVRAFMETSVSIQDLEKILY